MSATLPINQDRLMSLPGAHVNQIESRQSRQNTVLDIILDRQDRAMEHGLVVAKYENIIIGSQLSITLQHPRLW